VKNYQSFFFELINKKYSKRLFQRAGVLFSHSLIYFVPDRGLKITVFIYDAHIEDDLFRLYMKIRRRNFKLRYKRLKKKYMFKSYRFSSLFKYSNRAWLRYTSHVNKNLVRGVKHLRAFLFTCIRGPVHTFFFRSILTKLSYRILKFDVIPKSRISFICLSSSNMTARSVANFAIRKLRSKNSVNNIFFPLLRGFSSVTAGFKVVCSGRFTKRQRSSHLLFRAGRTPYSSFATPIDFCFASVPLKYGVGSMKIWITKFDFVKNDFNI
jgi:hypothetical protein